MRKWEEFCQDTRPRVILVSKNGKKKEVYLQLRRKILMVIIQLVVMGLCENMREKRVN